MAKVKEGVDTDVQKPEETSFAKQQLISSETFKHCRAAMTVCLDDNKKYTISQAQAALDKFMKGR